MSGIADRAAHVVVSEKLVARDVLDGSEPLLEQFRLRRFDEGRMQPASRGPYRVDVRRRSH